MPGDSTERDCIAHHLQDQAINQSFVAQRWNMARRQLAQSGMQAQVMEKSC